MLSLSNTSLLLNSIKDLTLNTLMTKNDRVSSLLMLKPTFKIEFPKFILENICSSFIISNIVLKNS